MVTTIFSGFGGNGSGGGVIVPASILATAVATNVSPSVLTTVLTLPIAGTIHVTEISCTGEDYAKFQVFVDTTLIETKRSGPDRDAIFEYLWPLKLLNGQVLDVKVIHFYSNGGSYTSNFNCTVKGFG